MNQAVVCVGLHGLALARSIAFERSMLKTSRAVAYGWKPNGCMVMEMGCT